MADYYTIKSNAQLRVVRDQLGFSVEYMNPNTTQWVKFTTVMNPEHALRICSEIGIAVQDIPKAKYEIENFDPPTKVKKHPMDRFEYGD